MRPVAAADKATITALIKTNPTMLVGAGLELINRDLNVLSDLSSEFVSGEVSHSNFSTLPGSFSGSITTQLAWGSAIIRPYMLVGGEGLSTVRFNLGAYFTSTPDYVTGTDPTTYSIVGYDILDGLNQPVGDSYAVNAGVEYIAAIENILLNQGYTKYTIDSARAGTLLPNARGWAMTDNPTWLSIVNDLLAAIGYRGIYSDWDGQLICEPYFTPESRNIEWTYDDGQYTSQLDPQQTVTHDYYATPNRWVAVRSNNAEGVTPTEGDGIAIYQNDSDGETSVEARQRVITKRIDVDAADQDALIAALMQQVSADKTVATNLAVTTTPNPLHWHFDILSIETAELGYLKIRENGWRLPLDGQPMEHDWAVI